MMTERIGTPAFMAPEAYGGEEYGKRCDVYSFAMTVWSIFTEKIPYLLSFFLSFFFWFFNFYSPITHFYWYLFRFLKFCRAGKRECTFCESCRRRTTTARWKLSFERLDSQMLESGFFFFLFLLLFERIFIEMYCLGRELLQNAFTFNQMNNAGPPQTTWICWDCWWAEAAIGTKDKWIVTVNSSKSYTFTLKTFK